MQYYTIFAQSLGYPGISVYLSIQKIAVPTESDVAVVTLGTGSAGILAAQLLELKCKKVFAISGNKSYRRCLQVSEHSIYLRFCCFFEVDRERSQRCYSHSFDWEQTTKLTTRGNILDNGLLLEFALNLLNVTILRKWSARVRIFFSIVGRMSTSMMC